MTPDEDKDPPIPSYLEGISLRRVHDGKVTEEQAPDEDPSAEDE